MSLLTTIRGKRKELLLLGSTVIILLCITEYALRANGKYATYNERVGGSFSTLFGGYDSMYNIYTVHQQIVTDGSTEFSYGTLSNNEGLLDHDFRSDSSSHGRRVMVFGDSFIQGMGAPVDSSCTRLAGDFLNQVPDSSGPYEVLNCGICGSDPFFNFILFRDRLLRYHPQAVILAVNSTDINDMIIRGGMERFSQDPSRRTRAPFYEPLYAHSYIFRHILHDILRYDWMFVPPSCQQAERDRSTALIDAAIDSFASVCAGQGIAFGVILQPINYECIHSDTIHPGVRAHCRVNNIPVYDLQQYLCKRLPAATDREALFWRVDGHFNSTGYTYYGAALSDFILSLDPH